MDSLFAGISGLVFGASITWVVAARSTRIALENEMRREWALLSSAAQQLRTPLSDILGLAQTLSLRRDDLPAEDRTLVEKIGGAGADAKAVLLDVIDILEIQSGRMRIKRGVDLLPDAMDAVKRMNAHRADTRGVELDLELRSSARGWFLYDDLRLRQCVGAMVRQCVLQSDGGAVRVSVETRPHPKRKNMRLICVIVRDESAGLPPETAASYFSSRDFGKNPLLMKSGGSPLSLVVAKMLANLMGGDLTVESRLGRGVVFTLSLPAKFARRSNDNSSANDIRPLDVATRLLRGKTVLVVEANSVSLQVMESCLRRVEPGRFLTARNGAEALEILKREKCGLVILDTKLPVMDGLTLVRRIRTANAPWRAVPIVAVSAAATGDDRQASFNAGVDAFLAKPVSPEALYETLARRLIE